MAFESNLQPKTDEAKRLLTVYLHYGGSQKSFSEQIGISASTLSRMLNSVTPITVGVVKYVCFNMGYSANWFIAGIGPKKLPIDKSSSIVTDLAKYKTDLEITNAQIARQKERINYLEKQMEELIKTVEDLKQTV